MRSPAGPAGPTTTGHLGRSRTGVRLPRQQQGAPPAPEPPTARDPARPTGASGPAAVPNHDPLAARRRSPDPGPGRAGARPDSGAGVRAVRAVGARPTPPGARRRAPASVAASRRALALVAACRCAAAACRRAPSVRAVGEGAVARRATAPARGRMRRPAAPGARRRTPVVVRAVVRAVVVRGPVFRVSDRRAPVRPRRRWPVGPAVCPAAGERPSGASSSSVEAAVTRLRGVDPVTFAEAPGRPAARWPLVCGHGDPLAEHPWSTPRGERRGVLGRAVHAPGGRRGRAPRRAACKTARRARDARFGADAASLRCGVSRGRVGRGEGEGAGDECRRACS